MRISKGLALGAAAVFACLAAHAAAQSVAKSLGAQKTRAQFVGGFRPDACRYPAQPRREGISACCIMDLDIGADGRVLTSDGHCTHPAFLAPTQRCLAAQSFMPATVNGQPVRALQSIEYEWRSWDGSGAGLCQKLKTS
ncbi:MAG: energy transducer TonB [Hyphomonadaceae bacterium]|nr:energy transducer TonB [Hyphomonadaceae bacterium]